MSRAAINSLSISIHAPLITGLAASIGSKERGRPMTMNTDREREKKKKLKKTQVNLGNTKAMRELHA